MDEKDEDFQKRLAYLQMIVTTFLTFGAIIIAMSLSHDSTATSFDIFSLSLNGTENELATEMANNLREQSALYKAVGTICLVVGAILAMMTFRIKK